MFRCKMPSHKRGGVSSGSREEGWLQHKRAGEYGRQKKLILPWKSACFTRRSEPSDCPTSPSVQGSDGAGRRVAFQAKLRKRNLLNWPGKALRNSSFIRFSRAWNKLPPVLLSPQSTDLFPRCLAPPGWGLCSSLGYSSEVRKPDFVWPLLPSWLSSSHPLIIILIKAATLQEPQILVVDDCCDSFGPGFACEWHEVIEFLPQTGAAVFGVGEEHWSNSELWLHGFPLLPHSLILAGIRI